MPLSPALLALLTRATQDARVPLSEADALDLARQYGRKGVRVKASALPLPPGEAIATEARPLDVKRAYGRLARSMEIPERQLGRVLGQLSPRQRAAVSDRVQDAFERDMTTLARTLEKTGDLAAWQRASGARIVQHLVEQRALGAGRELRERDVSGLREAVQTQTTYLSRFADTLAIRRLKGQELTAQGVAARAELYGGAGREAFFQALEQSEDVGRSNIVIRYEARDDDRTCPRCLAAEGWYLPGNGPYPGSVCLGRGRCRCTRRAEYNPAVWRRLMGLTAAAAA